MSGNILITEADRCDIPELVKLRVEYLKEAFGSISVEELARLSDELTEYFGRTLGKSCAAFVAKDGESVVSSAVLVIYERPVSPSLKTGLIGETVSVYTKPEYRRRGLCSKVIKAMVDYGKTHGLDRIELDATEMGAPVYEKQGFSVYDSPYVSMRYDYK